MTKLEAAYRELELSEDDSLDTIKEKYYLMAKKYHPDLNSSSNAAEKMKKINAAYEVILNSFSFNNEDFENESKSNDNKENQAYSENSESEDNIGKDFATWFVVILPKNRSVRIPNICPVTLERECSFSKKLRAKNLDSFETCGKRTTTHTSSIEIPFPVKDQDTASLLRKNVNLSIDFSNFTFGFKSKTYAQIFAILNNAEVVEQTQKERVVSKAKDITAKAGTLLLFVLSLFPWLIFIIIAWIVGGFR